MAKPGSQARAPHAKDKRLKAYMRKTQSEIKQATKSAESTNELFMETAGFLEAETAMEKTYKVSQDELAENVDVQTKQKQLNLVLDTYGPYQLDYSSSGNNLLLGGRKGHLASFNWKSGALNCELHLNETIRAVKYLQNDGEMMAVSQKKYTYIYDHQGTEVHQMRGHIEANHLEYLPYHYLLVSGGNTPFIKYQDVSTGSMIAELRTKLGPTSALAASRYNAVIHAGHSNGVVTLWAPTVQTPLVKLQSARGGVNAIAIDRSGRHMAVAGADRSIKIWDLRQYKPLDSYYSATPATSLSISDTGLLAVGWGPHVQVWKNCFRAGKNVEKETAPYMNHLIPGSSVAGVKFAPFEDFLGVGHAKGFSSLIIPGSGEANFDSLEANPYQRATRTGRREAETTALLEKLQPDMIALDPDYIGSVSKRAVPERLTAAESEARQEQLDVDEASRLNPLPHTKAKNSKIRKFLRKKSQNVVDERKLRLEAALEKEKRMRSNRPEPTENASLRRFQSKKSFS